MTYFVSAGALNSTRSHSWYVFCPLQNLVTQWRYHQTVSQ